MDVVSWHEGDETEYFTRIIYLYVDERIKGFVAESGELGWRVFISLFLLIRPTFRYQKPSP